MRVYEQIYGWRAGLDPFAPEFQTYWLSILWTEILIGAGLGIALVQATFGKPASRHVGRDARQEMRAIVDNANGPTAYAVAIYWVLAPFTRSRTAPGT